MSIDVYVWYNNGKYIKTEESERMEEQKLFAEAVAFAAIKHQGQKRKDGSPYIYHPIKVAELLKNEGYNLQYQMVAILHDILEDTDATEDDVEVFGRDILEAVKLVTRPTGMSEENYVQAILANPMATAVKNADKIHNMMDVIECENREWARRYTEKVKKYYKGKFSVELDQIIERAEKI